MSAHDSVKWVFIDGQPTPVYDVFRAREIHRLEMDKAARVECYESPSKAECVRQARNIRASAERILAAALGRGTSPPK